MLERPTSRRERVREHRVRLAGTWWTRVAARVARRPAAVGAALVIALCGIALLGETSLDYSIGRRVDQPVIARVDFSVADPKKTAADREAARAAVPSYFRLNATELTYARIRTELMRLYGAAADSSTYDDFVRAATALNWPVDDAAFHRLRSWAEMPNEAGRAAFERLVEQLPLEGELVVRDLQREPRQPASAKDYIILAAPNRTGELVERQVPLSQLVPHGNERALRGSATQIAKTAPVELRSVVEAVVWQVFREQPTIVFDQKHTLDAMDHAEKETPEAATKYERGKPYINPGVLGSEDYALLEAERTAYLKFLTEPGPDASRARKQRDLERLGLVGIVASLAIGLLIYVSHFQPTLLDGSRDSVTFASLIVAVLLTARILDVQWPQVPELVLTPCLMAAAIMAIAYPQRFALGASCILSLTGTTIVRGDLGFLLPLLVGATVVVAELREVRARTKLMSVGLSSAVIIVAVCIAEGLMRGHAYRSLMQHSLWAGACAVLAALLISGLLPLIERAFRTATALTLLEWRDPTRPLLQLLAREAPGTYAHSLVIGTLAQAACERIKANGLLAQVGALYHDIGKIPKAHYFTENQDPGVNRHDRLAPSMSLLIILGHVKDGLEMAREYKLPRVLHQFIEEHHGTTVVRYFHHVASEKQAQVATGRHDREVSEAEFRYPGPTPRSRESAVLMLCDGVEGAVRSLPEPNAGRIEAVVHEQVNDRLNDGQFDQCEITLREIRLVEESLVKSLCGIYHGRVAYPKAKRPGEESAGRESTTAPASAAG